MCFLILFFFHTFEIEIFINDNFFFFFTKHVLWSPSLIDFFDLFYVLIVCMILVTTRNPSQNEQHDKKEKEKDITEAELLAESMRLADFFDFGEDTEGSSSPQKLAFPKV